MKTIERIRRKFLDNQYEFAIPHFFEEMADDDLEFSDIETIISNGYIRRKFTHDPRGTRYEIAGVSLDGRNIAVVCRLKSTGKLLLITTYAIYNS